MAARRPGVFGPARLARRIGAVLAAMLLCACAAAPRPAASTASFSLRFIGEQRIAHRQPFQGTVVGGLSSIDYDERSGSWVLASDDRSEIGPARFYTARLDFDEHHFGGLALTGQYQFRRADGSVYPAPARTLLAQHGAEVADIEAMRVDPQDGSLWYASEGSRTLGADPFVKRADRDGAQLARLALPAMFKTDPQRQMGPRNNLSFEGMTFAPGGQSLWLGMEAPLYQDGAPAGPEHGALSRFTQLDRSGEVLAQYAYASDPVQGKPAPGRYGDNGVSEILALDRQHLLALERSGVQNADGRFVFHIRLYEVELQGATAIAALPALADVAVQPLRKRLVLDFDAAGLDKVDNLEGMSWGPLLANGHASLVLVSDDNFSPDQVTQLLAFEVVSHSSARR
jgi:hypothetical protein